MASYLKFYVIFWDTRPPDEVIVALAAALEVPLQRSPADAAPDQPDQDRAVGRTLGMELSLSFATDAERGFEYRLTGMSRSWVRRGSEGAVDLTDGVVGLLHRHGFATARDFTGWRLER